MAQYYSLDEAASKLGISVPEFRKGIATKWKNLRRFPDKDTLRFQAREIDELARTLGRTSAADLHVGDAPLPLADKPASGIIKKSDETAFVPPSSDEFIPLADDAINLAEKGDRSGSDSDVKLESSGKLRAKGRQTDETTEILELADDSSKKMKGSFQVKSDTPKSSGPRSGQVTSEFDLNLSSDSDDFDLELTDDSDEVPVGAVARKGPRSGDSGINLQDPTDSGISLEKESSEFELQLEPGAKTPPPTPKDDSDSEFELTLDDSSGENPIVAEDQKDIFETDFELPAIDDSGSEDRTSGTDLEESDFDLSVEDESADEESASEVVAIEEDEAGDELKAIDDDDEPRAVRTVEAAPAEWGTLPVAVLIPSLFVLFFVSLMGFELLRSMWGYHAGAPVSGGITRAIGGIFGKFED